MKNIFNKKKSAIECKHKKAYYFHENAPMYCPECDNYIDGGHIIPKTNK